MYIPTKSLKINPDQVKIQNELDLEKDLINFINGSTEEYKDKNVLLL